MTTADQHATFAFVDLAGLTGVTGAPGDREALAALRAFQARVQEVLAAEDQLVKTIGDAAMLRFPTTRNAVVALVQLLQRGITTPDAVLLPRAGAHHGGAVAVEGDYYGATVNLASRVAGFARGGQLLVTSHVAAAARELDAVVTHLAAPELRDVSGRVDLWEVRVDAGRLAAESPSASGMSRPPAPTSSR